MALAVDMRHPLKNTNPILGRVAGSTEAQKKNCQTELYSHVINYSFQQCDADELFFFFFCEINCASLKKK